jgi:hypothetical protein
MNNYLGKMVHHTTTLTSGGARRGNPDVAVEFPACAAGNATAVHAEDRCGEGQEAPKEERGSMGIPHWCVAVTAVHKGMETASVPDLKAEGHTATHHSCLLSAH